MNEEEQLLNDICTEANEKFPGIGLACDFEDMQIFTVYSGKSMASDGQRIFDTRETAKSDQKTYPRGIHTEFVSFCMKWGYLPEYGTGNSSHWVKLFKMKPRETI